MKLVWRLFSEYKGLARTLSARDFAVLLQKTVLNSRSLLESRNLSALDQSMSRDMTVRFGNSRITIPVHQVDQTLNPFNDNPTFGNIRELYARNCYLRHLPLRNSVRTVLDLGANRGMFSLLALVHLNAELVVGVEPQQQYEDVFRLLLHANGCNPARAPHYSKFVGSPSTERTDGEKYISIETILREQSVDRFDLVKIDIEGAEKDLFREPAWLSRVDNITMELHPQFAGNLSLIPAVLQKYDLNHRLLDQHGIPSDISSAMFLVASRGPL